MTDGKTLYLMRHAEAAWMGSRQHDFDRPLDPRGEYNAEAVGRRLKAHSTCPHLIISSPALRAAQTATFVATELGIPVDAIVFRETIYEASTSDLLKIIHALDDHQTNVLLIGHNPALTWLITRLTGKHNINATTASIATIRLPSSHWKGAGDGAGKLLAFDHP